MAKKAAKKAAKKIILPKKMSSLIKIALRDIRLAEESEDYVINMNRWHVPKDAVCTLEENPAEVIKRHQVCSVCAAGAVMAFSLKAPKNKELEPEKFKGNETQLEALDSLREGDVGEAADRLELKGTYDCDKGNYRGGKEINYFNYNTGIVYYGLETREEFHREMTKLQVRLKKAGL